MAAARSIGMALAALAAGAGASPARVGVFTQNSDIGDVKQPGGATFDARTGTYRVVGNGDDLWAAKDDFHFVSRPARGDVAIAATITPVIDSAEPHSKAALMIRQDLTPDSPYADIAVHQNGLVALQYRATRGGQTYEWATPHVGPGRFRLERQGEFVSVAIADGAGVFRPTGGAVRLQLDGPYQVGLLVCSHSDVRTKTVDFSDVRIGRP